ncbi:class F sortase [Streptomyces albireticuli]|uniref:class F sortase n=2 Tax=Streptomyces albireticuli TaxID=1940 RepID=UPI001E5D26A4|nr:class F sortase [Streptomyces albireticuli]MCD9141129.1 class F sortase [Streptomyces albireticuli]MCD9160910.1 class F sortase [Streptomyces albireticuli]MCD9191033.1 class F sortase [Streptomyces albireticuli]
MTLIALGVCLILLGGSAPAPAPPPGPGPGATAPVSPGPGTAVPLPRSEPVRLAIPSLGVSSPVMSLGQEADGTVEVPPIAKDAPAGWYRGSPTPGEAGASVLLGHSTVGRYGDGVFFALGRLRPGATVEVTRADGVTAVFTVRAVEQYAKADFPADRVYQGSGAPRLRLVTCGGPRDAADGYRDNIVVYADLTGRYPA